MEPHDDEPIRVPRRNAGGEPRDIDIDDDRDAAQPFPAGSRPAHVAAAIDTLLDALELDRSDPNLIDTPQRVARAYEEMFAGLRGGNMPSFRTFPNTDGYSEMVSVFDVPFYSVCAHHFLPFFGSAHIAYIPSERIVGLSKLARLVDFYARRPQLQERMTEQIVACVKRMLDPRGVMVVVEGRHFCLEMRGVSKPGVVTTTSAISGAFEDGRVRQEFLALLSRRPGNGQTG